MPAVPGTEYTFDKLDFEVREYSPSLAAEIGSWFSLSGLFGFLSLIAIIGAIAAALFVVYKQYMAKKEANAAGGVERARTGNVEMANLADGQDKHQELHDEFDPNKRFR